jgi:hypothetical protein
MIVVHPLGHVRLLEADVGGAGLDRGDHRALVRDRPILPADQVGIIDRKLGRRLLEAPLGLDLAMMTPKAADARDQRYGVPEAGGESLEILVGHRAAAVVMNDDPVVGVVPQQACDQRPELLHVAVSKDEIGHTHGMGHLGSKGCDCA